MLKVFLVEDETVIREGLRDRIPWEQYGYRFVGEAADGEVALPLIRKTRPDVLITDIKMPFMDGLSLSRIVREEFPKTKILIISGYDDFEYAREAISIGVDQYILKPVTRMSLRKVLHQLFLFWLVYCAILNVRLIFNSSFSIFSVFKPLSAVLSYKHQVKFLYCSLPICIGFRGSLLNELCQKFQIVFYVNRLFCC